MICPHDFARTRQVLACEVNSRLGRQDNEQFRGDTNVARPRLDQQHLLAEVFWHQSRARRLKDLYKLSRLPRLLG